MVSGGLLSLFSRTGTGEPLCARPFSYLRSGLLFGFLFFYWDYARRVALEDVMRAEEKQRYFKMIRAMNNNIRFGEEDEIGNMTEYLASTTTRY